ncbi:uncharacterized protein GGS25DRAFT_534612 [Hypoxylon fragiforme]|uniref:uncharacterized protein n=1 Tax=Hypoxylon fragiforme TaxID=63214 RepID=UPI0020C65642|nr:uncharacterized protein GGS25DRAFT_534612 [Hypoxylon fragiforme]KAI2604139.1 hypothetical protein GGS25DRAFT_534612 [Hypoxylon fragiforme]
MQVPTTFATLAVFLGLAFSSPMPQDDPPETDLCLQRKFLTAERCEDIDPAYTNATLPSAGWYCCWQQGPFTPPPALPVSAWLTFAEDGSVATRCLTSGACTAGLPNGQS